MSNIISGVIGISIIGLLIAFGPLALIASLNTLFPVLAIKYGILEWLSAAFLLVVINGVNASKD